MKLHLLESVPDPLRPAGRAGPPARARSTRTLLLGGLLGLFGALLVLAVAGIAGRPVEPRLADDVPADLAARLRPRLPGTRDGPVWRIVSRVATPWGAVVRLRPYVGGIEVRGADCVVQPEDPTDGPVADEIRLERDPATVNWTEIEAAVSRVAPAEKSRAILERLLGGEEWATPAVAAALAPGPTTAALRVEAEPRWFVSLRGLPGDAAIWRLHAELVLAGEASSLTGALAALPWRGARPDGHGPVDLLLTCDPATLEIREARDARILAEGSALLFDPNPVAASGRGELREGDLVDLWRRRVTLPGLDGGGALLGARVAVATGRPPRAHEASLVYDYASSDPRFEEAMAYYHGDRSLARAESLGYSGLWSSPLRLRVHASSADNSWYSRPARQVFFGDGGVDDPEDADIILHETAHALHDAIVPGFGDGDTRAISEGFADFWAASITGDACVGDWDATSYSPPCLRRTDEPAVWPEWVLGAPHHDGAIWSALLWDLRATLGARDAERLALAALFEQDTGTTFTEAARGLLRAAERLGLGARANEIREAIARRGLGPRRIELTLAPGEARRIELPSAGRFLGEPAAAIVLQGDGRILFPATGAAAESRPFPQGPPCVVPCAPGDASAALRLQAEVTIEGQDARLRLEWREFGDSRARAVLLWDLATGAARWEIEDLPTGDVRFYSGAVAGPDGSGTPLEVVALRLADLPPEGIAGLRAFRAEIPAGGAAGASAPVLGARYEARAEAGGTFRLRLVRRPLDLRGDGPLLVVQPNPVRDRAEVRILLRRPARGAVRIHDAAGRRVALLAEGEWPGGVTVLEWEPQSGGRRLPAGLYWIRLEAGGRTASRRALVLP